MKAGGMKGYGVYNGRSTVVSVLLGVGAVLALFGLCVAMVPFFLQRFVVYSADGARFSIPFLQRGADPADGVEPEYPTPDIPLLIRETPHPAAQFFRAVSWDADAPYEELLAAASERGANAVILSMKKADGMLGYVSEQPLAVQAEVSASDPARNEEIRRLNAGELYTVARMSCFRDHKLAKHARALSFSTYSGYLWTDENGYACLSPASKEARAYLIETARELCELGFDEILLDCANFPTRGNLHYIKPGTLYDKTGLQAVLTRFYEELRAALSGYPVKLSVSTERDVLQNGFNVKSGQSLGDLIAYFDRIYIPSAEEADAPFLENAGFPTPERDLIVEGDAAHPGLSASFAVFFPPGDGEP